MVDGVALIGSYLPQLMHAWYKHHQKKEEGETSYYRWGKLPFYNISKNRELGPSLSSKYCNIGKHKTPLNALNILSFKYLWFKTNKTLSFLCLISSRYYRNWFFEIYQNRNYSKINYRWRAKMDKIMIKI